MSDLAYQSLASTHRLLVLTPSALNVQVALGVNLCPSITTGNAVCTNGSNVVTFTGVTLDASVVNGCFTQTFSGVSYVITALLSPTSVQLQTPFTGTTHTGAYTLVVACGSFTVQNLSETVVNVTITDGNATTVHAVAAGASIVRGVYFATNVFAGGETDAVINVTDNDNGNAVIAVFNVVFWVQ